MAAHNVVPASDGVELAVYDSGDPAAATILAIHGYPDNAGVWDPVVTRLQSRFHVVRYDVRGCGSSSVPVRRRQYGLDQLEADFHAVVDACSPDRPVHLLGHDWGSIQGWHFVTSAASQRRIASFSSISGPSLNHAAHWMRANLRPSLPEIGKLGRQLADSYYLALFQLPLLPELAWRSGVLDLLMRGTGSAPEVGAGGYHRTEADKINGLQLYRANLWHGFGGHSRTDLPVQVLAPQRDPYVSVSLQVEAPVPFVPRLTSRVVPGSHWLPLTDPDLVTDWAADFVQRIEAESPAGG